MRACKHGMHNTPTYHAWENMKARCLNPKHPAYKHYGARGVTVCDRWLDFARFFADMGEAPAGLTLERVDNDLGYSPANCKWATRVEQQGNRRNSRIVEFGGERIVLEQLAKRFGVSSSLINNRIFKLGWDVEKAATAPPRKIKRKAEWRTQQPTSTR